MGIATTTLFLSCLLAVCYGQLLPCAPDCRYEDDGALFPDPRDCSKFFQCANNIAVPHHCPTGLVFNPVVKVCDFTDSAGCVQDPDDDCSDGKTTTAAATVETTTVVNTTEHASTDAGTTAPSIGYTTSKILVTIVRSTTTTGLRTTTPQPAGTTTGVETTTIQPTVAANVQPGSTTVSGECKPECPSAEAMFPNPRDCSSFFKCAFNQPFLMKCPDGQWYDAPNERCEYPELAECNAGPDVPCVAVTNPTVPPQETTTVVSGPITTDGGDDCMPSCPSAEAMFPNPRDCSSFFKCAFNHPFLMKCPDGQWYDALNERCDYPEFVDCNAGPDVPCVAVTNPTVPPQETTTGVSVPTTTDGGEDCVPPCPSDEAMYPNPRDCGSFYQCSFGMPFLLKCPEGQHYAAALERCDYPEVAECTAGPDSPCVAVTNSPQFFARRR